MTAALLIGLLALAVLHEDRGAGGPGPERADAPTAGSEAGSAGLPTQPTLRGSSSGEEPAARDEASGGPGPPAGASGSGGAPPVPRAWPLAPLGATLGSRFALAPGAVEDEVVGSARAPLGIHRSDVVGRVRPFGVLDDPGGGAVRWIGVAHVDREDRATSEAADDTEEPVTTAVRGVVVDEAGQPIRGAEVLLYSSFYLRQAYYDHRVRQIGRAFTAEDGTFDLRPLDLDTVHFGADGEVLVTVRHPGYADLVAQALPGIVPGRESDVGALMLPASGATVRGAVLDLAGAPVVGAVVRVSGVMNPVEYDKTERMVVLSGCPAAVTDEQGRYELTDFAPGLHEISVTIRIDCVLHEPRRLEGVGEWSPRVRAGHSVRGRVVDPGGAPVAAAVVAGGGNWTPTNPDGTFWLDNVFPGPLTLQVAHHAWHTVFVPGVLTDGEEVVLATVRPLARIRLEVVDAAERAVPLVALDWAWPAGGGPGPFAPDSRYWSDPAGRYAVTVPEGAVGATASDAAGAVATLAAEDLADGTTKRLVLLPPGDGR